MTRVFVEMDAVETSQAGPGNLEVTVNGGQVPTSAQAHGLHTYAISFTPKEPKPHEVELKFNGENVPGELRVFPLVLGQRFLFFNMEGTSCHSIHFSRALIGSRMVWCVKWAKGTRHFPFFSAWRH